MGREGTQHPGELHTVHLHLHTYKGQNPRRTSLPPKLAPKCSGIEHRVQSGALPCKEDTGATPGEATRLGGHMVGMERLRVGREPREQKAKEGPYCYLHQPNKRS